MKDAKDYIVENEALIWMPKEGEVYVESDIIKYIELAQKDAYNEGIKDAIENVVTKQVQVEYEGVRAGGFYTKTVIDKDSIIKLKKI